MLKWAAKKLGVGTVEVHLDDLADYIELLAQATPEEVAQIAAEAAALRTSLEAKGIEVGTPLDYVQRKPAMIMRLEEYVETAMKTDRPKALGMAAWMHTLRAAKHMGDGQRAEVFRELVMKLWRELGKGAPPDAGSGFFPIDFVPTPA